MAGKRSRGKTKKGGRGKSTPKRRSKARTQTKVVPTPPIEALGGVFLASEKPERLIAWYRSLGIPVTDEGMHMFPDKGVFSIQRAATSLPQPMSAITEEPYGQRRVTLNLRVVKLNEVIHGLKTRGETVAGPRDYGYGMFAWVNDPDGNVIELWQATAEKA